MNNRYYILSGLLLLLMSGGALQSCQQDEIVDLQPDITTLIAEGRYLSARSEDISALASDTEDPKPFEVGTPYRLLAFTKKYDKANPKDNTRAATPRFNKVAWEGKTSTGLRFFNIDSNPDKWFGFMALDGEAGGTDGLVSLDFYGFTYGVKADHPDTYIPVEGWQDGGKANLADLKRTETVPEGGDLNDLMRGELLNQNIETAGKDDNLNNAYSQSIMRFNHCFSKLHFQVSQQDIEENKEGESKPATKSFENLFVDSIVVTNTRKTGTVSLADGKVKVSTPIDRKLKFKSSFTGEVKVSDTDAGEMIIFPSHGADLAEGSDVSAGADPSDGYHVGLKIAVKSTVKEDIENMLVNTGSVDADGNAVITETTDADGAAWYHGTIVKNNIIDYFPTDKDGNPLHTPLYFKQNTAYMLIIVFQKNGVRIITVIPQVEEWLPGEGTADNPWQEQALGQPQMFDNIVWSDRNLGADDFDPTGSEYEYTVGYFYQAGRNVPYFPFKWGKEAMDNGVTDEEELKKYYYPDLADIRNQDLANGSSAYRQTEYSFYPIVDPAIRNMHIHQTDNNYGGDDPRYKLFDNGKLVRLVDFQWLMWPSGNGTPQMNIPESWPVDDHCFNFMLGTSQDPTSGLKDSHNMHWELGQPGQPTTGSWIIPSSDDFLTIFPSTPHAGNITFRRGGDNSNPMGWNGAAMENSDTVLRVTVPYYFKDMSGPAKNNASEKYRQAWNTLNINGDDGCSTAGYWTGPGADKNPDYEPDGDPEDGYASVYIISRAGDDLVEPEILKGKDLAGKDWAIKSWGTIYAIKRIYTPQAYRMRWRVLNATESAANPCFYVEICRYRCNADDKLTVDNYKKKYDWDHPAAKIYFPICGLGDWTGAYINFGTECQYATSDEISGGKTSAVQIKVSGNDAYNAYIAVVRGVVNRNFGMQIRPIGGG